MTLTQSEPSEMLTFFENLNNSIEGNDPLQKLRASAWTRFQELGLPTRKQEAFCYLRLRNFFSQNYLPAGLSQVKWEDIQSAIVPECQKSVLVFVNGFFQNELSNTSAIPKKVVISSLQNAMRTYGTFIQNQWAKSLQEETDPLAALNGSLHQTGHFVYLPPKTIVEPPIQILHVIDAHQQPMFIMPRIHFFIGAQSEVNIISSQTILSGSSYGINQAIDFAIEEGAQVKYNTLQYHIAPNIWHFDALRASLKRDSNFRSVHVTEGSATVRNDYRVALIGENAQASLNGMWMLGDVREAHTHVLIDHQVPHCRSFQLFKGVLNDASKSSFEGKILVRQPAQKTDAFQLNNNLLLSDKAHADSKPNLEIFADDVKASHGATVGQLDKEQIFYMKARGFNEKDAQKMLIRSFCKEVIDLISVPSLQTKITKRYVET